MQHTARLTGNILAPIFAALIVFTFPAVSHCAEPAMYLERELWSALTYRDQYFESAATALGVHPSDLFRAENAAALEAYLKKKRDVRNPWFSLLAAIAGGQNSATARGHYRNALTLARTDPGATWVIYHELLRRGITGLADSALIQFERQFLAAGAQGVPLLAQHFMKTAVASDTTPAAHAAHAWAWVRVFAPYTPWPALWGTRRTIFNNPRVASEQIREIRETVQSSWQLQLESAARLLVWLTKAFQALVAGVFTAMFLKYFQRSIHPLAEKFPSAVPMFVRTLLVGSLMVSLIAFGPIPLVWVLSFLLWPHMQVRERLFAGLCLVLVAISPLGAFANASLRIARSPDRAPALYTRVIREGFSQDLHSRVKSLATEAPGDQLSGTALAVSYYKSDSLAASRLAAESVLRFAPDDPVAQTIVGITNYRLGNAKAAKESFERVMQQYPDYAPGYFNLGKTMLSSMETLKGADLISQAARVQPRAVELFIRKNDYHFGNDWPWIRHFLLTDYPPRYYWTNIFPRHLGTWNDASSLWGVTFLGLPPQISLGIFVVLLLVILIRGNVAGAAGRSRVKKVLTCELCHAPMCKLCAKGPYCGSCFKKLSSVSVEQKRQALKATLYDNMKLRQTWTASLLDVLFPGVGMLAEATIQHRTSTIFMTISALLFGAVAAIVTLTYAYPFWISQGLYQPLYVFVALYVLGFIIRGAIKGWHATRATKGA